MFDAVPDMAAKRAELSGHALAFRDAATGRDWSFREVDAAANGMAAALRERGLVEGDRLASICLNGTAFFVLLLACQKAGLILCPLNWRQPPAELTETLEPVSPRLILHDAGFAEPAAEVARQLGIPALSLDDDDLRREGTAGSVGMIPADRPWYLLFTSGTTGRPKAVIQTARMAWANAVNIGQAIHLTPADRSVNFLPVFHTAGINLYTLPVFLTGGSSTVLPKFEAAEVLELLRTGAITQFFGVPAIYQAFSLSDEVERIDWTAVRCGCGGAPLPEPLIRFFAERGARVLNGFGMTETGPTVFLMDEGHAEAKIGSVGRPQMLTECRLDGVPDGEPGEGEILLRGPNITPGYYGNPEATEQAFAPGGWLKSGDVGQRDADGFVRIVDRIKDMYISGGENVYPAEVERVLVEHPAVLEAAVIGIPDEKWGETGAAFLIPRPGETIEPEPLRQWCRARLAAYKIPARVEVVEDFPRTAAGKVRKPDLRARIA
ncbi:AMP-binding protein [Histidinibacterium aquaticum]|uniref:3-methylmercaptopropionyl-CoA ligase n=1 Tax=Histidinibacterium aquaticum TaxID=2613962 RepID=A0A5J5GJF9_9RHOB|nr:AMP-binding protein [Histidinibacterium aquaticum]KAA9007883.1 long-chain fatty acid--CoA ligase [Histidinibacterium aquaticum]